MDKMCFTDEKFPLSEGCEIICSRLYALKQAFRDVTCANDWKQPKGAASNKWRSKVRWDLANLIDCRAVAGGEDGIAAVDGEVQKAMREMAIMKNTLAQSAAAVPSEETPG